MQEAPTAKGRLPFKLNKRPSFCSRKLQKYTDRAGGRRGKGSAGPSMSITPSSRPVPLHPHPPTVHLLSKPRTSPCTLTLGGCAVKFSCTVRMRQGSGITSIKEHSLRTASLILFDTRTSLVLGTAVGATEPRALKGYLRNNQQSHALHITPSPVSIRGRMRSE